MIAMRVTKLNIHFVFYTNFMNYVIHLLELNGKIKFYTFYTWC